MKLSLIRMILIIGFLLATVNQSLVAKSTNKEYCYSTYHLEQQLKLNVNFAEVIEKQNVTMDMNIHVREISTSKLFSNANSEIRSFILLIKPNHSKVNGVAMEMSERYKHPFLVYVNADTGEIVDLKSTVDEQSVINEYLSFFDLFQYTTKSGYYQYRNGNGYYKVAIQNLNNTDGKVTKKNSGYVQSNSKVEVKNSQQSIVLGDSQDECFYHSSEIVESSKTTLSRQASIVGDASATVVLDNSHALSGDHFFFKLTEQLDLWPNFKFEEKINLEQALIKITELMESLIAITENKSEFLSVMKADQAVWPFIADYMRDNDLDEELSHKIFWALDKINTTKSVSALARISVSSLRKQLSYRAIIALSSTSAPLDSESFELVTSYVGGLSQTEFNSPESLLLVRVLGSLARRQSINFPVQSNEIMQFLYSQINHASGEFAASVMDAIGNLKDNIDSDGVDILMNGLNADSEIVKYAALQALAKVPYDADYSKRYVAQLESESYSKTKSGIIELLGNSPKTDSIVKNQLLSTMAKSNDLIHRKKALRSLRKIDYNFQVDELDLLQSQLRLEPDKTNQKLLAGLILKARRRK